MHVPVMVAEVMEYLAPRAGAVILDATCGLGGHTRALAEAGATVIACDRDGRVWSARERQRWNTRSVFVSIRHRLRNRRDAGGPKIIQLDGLLADLGVSRYQLTSGERGFSLMADGPLDMRMDRSMDESGSDRGGDCQLRIGKRARRSDLQIGRGKEVRKIARAIVRARPITTTGHLAKVILEASHRTGKIHPATQTFMALRIAVNQENEQLDALLDAIPKVVRPGGRVVILTFMSVEDRTVKRRFQAMAKDGIARILTRHVVRPAEEELRANPPSRSAKLRAVEIEESYGDPGKHV